MPCLRSRGVKDFPGSLESDYDAVKGLEFRGSAGIYAGIHGVQGFQKIGVPFGAFID